MEENDRRLRKRANIIICSSKAPSSFADPENSVRGEGGPKIIFLAINLFHNGSSGPPSRSNWTRGVRLLLEGGPYQCY